MTFPDIHWVLGPQQLVCSDQPHVLLHHQVLDDTRGSQRKPVPTVHQDSLPLLSGGIYALVDVLKAALLQGGAVPQGVGHVSDVHLEAGPAVAGAARAGAGYEVETRARFPGHAAHVDDAVYVITAQGAPVVSSIQVADVDVVCDLGDDRFGVLEVFGATGFGFRRIRASGSCWPRSSSPAVVTQLL